uniref:Exosome complex component CSL4 C-terminal domain-containing protein n=1 Tax=Romanomermis culicivorax TaxID=13658 RepID=A0A915KA44_ROMCU
MIRREDIKSKDRDSTVVFECFKIGDVILARVVSLADMLSCILSTAEENLGVVYGRCPNSENLPHKMVAQNFSDLVCKECHVRENRKVAKIPQNLNEK